MPHGSMQSNARINTCTTSVLHHARVPRIDPHQYSLSRFRGAEGMRHRSRQSEQKRAPAMYYMVTREVRTKERELELSSRDGDQQFNLKEHRV